MRNPPILTLSFYLLSTSEARWTNGKESDHEKERIVSLSLNLL